MADLTPAAKTLLEDHYGHVVRASMAKAAALAPPPVAFSPPEPELIDAVADSAQDFGIGLASPIDWAAFIPVLIAAVTTGNFMPLIPWIPQLGANAWAFIGAVINWFHKTPTTGGGPVITG